MRIHDRLATADVVAEFDTGDTKRLPLWYPVLYHDMVIDISRVEIGDYCQTLDIGSGTHTVKVIG